MSTSMDPFRTQLEKLVDDVQSLMRTVGIPRKDRKSFNQLLSFKSVYLPHSTTDELALIMDNFTPFETIFQENVLIFEQGFVNYGSLNGKPSPYIEEVAVMKKAFASLKLMYENLTPVHLTLQAHCHNFAGFNPNGVWVSLKSVHKFFSPLYELRDEYFSDAQPRTLGEYLTTVEALTAQSLYEDILFAGEGKPECDEALAKAKESALELEVMLLMDSVA